MPDIGPRAYRYPGGVPPVYRYYIPPPMYPPMDTSQYALNPYYHSAEERGRASIYQSIRNRANTDTRISTYWVWLPVFLMLAAILFIIAAVYMLHIDMDMNLLDLVTLLIPVTIIWILLILVEGILVYYMVERHDDHFKRDALLRNGIIDFLSGSSQRKGINICTELAAMNNADLQCRTQELDRSGLTWMVIFILISSILTVFGVIGPLISTLFAFIVLSFLTKDLYDHSNKQHYFNMQTAIAFRKLGLGKIEVSERHIPYRNNGIYILLSFITLTLFTFYWWYTVVIDGNAHFDGQWSFEDSLLDAMEEAEPEEQEDVFE